jgi:hypothetical protein
MPAIGIEAAGQIYQHSSEKLRANIAKLRDPLDYFPIH